MSRGAYRRKDVFTLGNMPLDVAAPYEVQISRHPDGHRVVEICNHSNVIARMMVDGAEGLIAARRIVQAVNAAEKNIAQRNAQGPTGKRLPTAADVRGILKDEDGPIDTTGVKG